MVLLPKHQRDLHRFLWREDPQQPIKDYRMTRLTFGVSGLPFAAIMAMRQNTMDHRRRCSLTSQAVMNDFYVDDVLDGADSIDEAIKLCSEIQELFELGGFVLGKWKSNELVVLAQIPCELVYSQSTQSIDIEHYTKVLGMEWNATLDTIRLVVSSLKQVEALTKRALLLDIARLYNVLDWCSPAIVKLKILLEHM